MNHNAHQSRLEEQVLMPGTAPRLRAVQRNGDGRHMDAADWECGVLSEQLDALGKDIHEARRIAMRTAVGHSPSPHGPRAMNGSLSGEHVALGTDTEILIRPVEPADAPLLRDMFEQLSALSRLRRFLTPVEHLTRHQLEYLSDVDHRSHEALVALDARTGEAVGVARYLRDERDRRAADVGVVVIDRWQGRGVGTALLRRLAERADARGYRRLNGTLLLGNDAGRRLIARFPATVSERRIPGATRVVAELPAQRD
jgi:RimJ/RimL family protein N-acetyltransferase